MNLARRSFGERGCFAYPVLLARGSLAFRRSRGQPHSSDCGGKGCIVERVVPAVETGWKELRRREGYGEDGCGGQRRAGVASAVAFKVGVARASGGEDCGEEGRKDCQSGALIKAGAARSIGGSPKERRGGLSAAAG